MSQHDYVLDNAAGAAFRADVNNALGAVVTQNSGATAPTTTYAGMPWFDTTTGLQKYRNAANTAWVIDSLSEASRGSIAMHATTMDLWALPQISDGTGAAVTITSIVNAPQAGARRKLYPIAGTVITNGATFAIDGAADYTTAAGDAIEFEAVTTSTYKVHIVKKDGTAVVGGSTQIQPISASVAASALTISASALSLDFRSTTLGSGTVTKVSGTPANTVISSGSTGGTTSGVQSDIAVLAINNAGTIELAWTNMAGGTDLSETGLISTTAEGGAGAADSATVIYSTTARTSVAYRVIGIIRSTQATAGTWATAPSLIQGAGGNALTSMQSLGHGQTWQSVSRVGGTTYYNTTGKSLFLNFNVNAVGGTWTLTVNGLVVTTILPGTGTYGAASTVIPPGASYLFNSTPTAVNELR